MTDFDSIPELFQPSAWEATLAALDWERLKNKVPNPPATCAAPGCSVVIPAPRKNATGQKYCSPKCCSRAFRARRKKQC